MPTETFWPFYFELLDAAGADFAEPRPIGAVSRVEEVIAQMFADRPGPRWIPDPEWVVRPEVPARMEQEAIRREVGART